MPLPKSFTQQNGMIPVFRLSIAWVRGAVPSTTIQGNGSEIISGVAELLTQYTTKDRIISLSPISISKRDDSTGSVGSCSVLLDDSDGVLKNLSSTLQLEGAAAELDILFDNSTDTGEILLGKCTNILWSEGERTLQFTIESEVSSLEAGFEPYVIDYPWLNPDSNGVCWPLVFGTPSHVPAAHAIHRTEGYLESMIWLSSDVFEVNGGQPVKKVVPDHSVKTIKQQVENIMQGLQPDGSKPLKVILTDKCTVNSYEFDETDTVVETGNPVAGKIYVRNGQLFPQNKAIQIIINGVVFSGSFEDNEFNVTEANAAKWLNVHCDARPADPDTNNTSVFWLAPNNVYNIVNHHCYFKDTNGESVYGYVQKQEGAKCWLSQPLVHWNGVPWKPTTGDVILSIYPIEKCGLLGKVSEYFSRMTRHTWFNKSFVKQSIPYSSILHHLTDLKNQNLFWEAEEETEVFQWSVKPQNEVYVCNLIPSKSVQAVYAYRHVRGRRIFSPVPRAYYTEALSYNIAGMQVSAILMPQALPDYIGQGWEDQLYVTLTSTIPNNIVDAIKYVLQTYVKSLTIDEESFGLAKSQCGNISTDFALLNKENALRFAQRLAWEASCALVTINGIATLTYLAIKPSPLIKFDQTNIRRESIEVSYSQMADIVTRVDFHWVDSYKPRRDLVFLDSKKRKKLDNRHIFIARSNIGFYGLIKEDRDILIYNVEDYVANTAKFHLTRRANSWTRVRFDTFLQGLALRPFNGIQIAVNDQKIIYDGIAVVESIVFDPKTKLSTIEAVLPIRQGGTTVDPNFWPGFFVKTVPNPSFKYKKLTYDKKTLSPNFNVDAEIKTKDQEGEVTTTAVVTSVDDPNNETTIPTGSDSVVVDVHGNSTSSGTPTQTSIPAFSKDSHHDRYVGETVRVVTNKNGKANIIATVDNKLVVITGPYWYDHRIQTNNSDNEQRTVRLYAIGWYRGYLTSANGPGTGTDPDDSGTGTGSGAGSGKGLIPNDPTKNFKLDAGNQGGAGSDVIICNLGETRERGWRKSVINQFPYVLPAKAIESFDNGILRAYVHLEAKVIRRMRLGPNAMQISYMVDPMENLDNVDPTANAVNNEDLDNGIFNKTGGDADYDWMNYQWFRFDPDTSDGVPTPYDVGSSDTNGWINGLYNPNNATYVNPMLDSDWIEVRNTGGSGPVKILGAVSGQTGFYYARIVTGGTLLKDALPPGAADASLFGGFNTSTDDSPDFRPDANPLLNPDGDTTTPDASIVVNLDEIKDTAGAGGELTITSPDANPLTIGNIYLGTVLGRFATEISGDWGPGTTLGSRLIAVQGGGTGGKKRRWVMITGSSPITGHAAQWTYSVVEVTDNWTPGGVPQVLPGGYSGSGIYNMLEGNNAADGTGMMGGGDEVSSDDVANGITLQQIPNGAVVELIEQKTCATSGSGSGGTIMMVWYQNRKKQCPA